MIPKNSQKTSWGFKDTGGYWRHHVKIMICRGIRSLKICGTFLGMAVVRIAREFPKYRLKEAAARGYGG
jgi:hypothetical protein